MQNPVSNQQKLVTPNIVIIRDNYYIYSIFHTLLAIMAIYLAYRCNRGFDLGSFLAACCFPYLYIIYIFATRGTCGILSNEPGLKKY